MTAPGEHKERPRALVSLSLSAGPNRAQAEARIVAATLTLLARELRESGPPQSLWRKPPSPALARELARLVASGQAEPIWAVARHPARGLVFYVPQAWESDFLGRPSARLLGPFMAVDEPERRQDRAAVMAELALQLARERGDAFLSIKTSHDPAVLNAFLAQGFYVAEIGASLSLTLTAAREAPPVPPGVSLLEKFDDPEGLAEGMGDFFYDGRHRRDPRVGPKLSAQLWRKIAAQDLGGAASPALVVWDKNKKAPAALACAKKIGDDYSLSILAVRPAWRGRGLGRFIMKSLLARLAPSATLLVETASYNIPALRLYQSLGFQPESPLAALHIHL